MSQSPCLAISDFKIPIKAGGVPQRANTPAAKPETPTWSQKGRRALTPASSPLASLCVLWLNYQPNTHTISESHKSFCKQTLMSLELEDWDLISCKFSYSIFLQTSSHITLRHFKYQLALFLSPPSIPFIDKHTGLLSREMRKWWLY